MIFEIDTVFNSYHHKGEEAYKEIVMALEEAKLQVIEKPIEKYPNYVHIYTDIEDLDGLNRLVKSFGCHIVYGDKTEDGVIIIEKYDTYRE